MLAAEGATVVITWRKGETAAAAVIASLAGTGHSAHHADVSDTASLNALAAMVRSAHGRADILVNPAGFTKAVPAHDLHALDDAFIDDMFRINWRGVFATIRAFRALLSESGDGLIVNVSSIAALNGVGSNVAYAAVKASRKSQEPMPYFVIHALDHHGKNALRLSCYPAHRAFLGDCKRFGISLAASGPLVSEDGTTAIGSFFVVEAEDIASVKAFNQSDPFGEAGLWESVLIHRFDLKRGTIGAPR
jgi:uncharacterized protein YciI